jgi:hypothetical protein
LKTDEITSLRDADDLLDKGVPDRLVPYVAFIALLALLYVANSHIANRMSVDLDKTKDELEDLRVEYHTSQAEYMFSSKQSEVAKRVSTLGLEESRVPPRILKSNK